MQTMNQPLSGTAFMLAQFRAMQNILSRDANALQINDAQKEIIQRIVEANADPMRMSGPMMETCCLFMLNQCMHVLQGYADSLQMLEQRQDLRAREAHAHEIQILFGDVAALYNATAPFAIWDVQLLTTKGKEEIIQAFHKLKQLAQMSAFPPVLSQNNASAPLILADLLRLLHEEDIIEWLSTERPREVIYCVMQFLLQAFPISSLDIEHGGILLGELHPHTQVRYQNFTATLQSIQFHDLGSVLRFTADFEVPHSLRQETKRYPQDRTFMWDGFEEVTDNTGKQYILQMMMQGCAMLRWNKRQANLVFICWPPLPQHGTLRFHTSALELSITEMVTIGVSAEERHPISQGVPRAPVNLGPAMDLIIELP